MIMDNQNNHDPLVMTDAIALLKAANDDVRRIAIERNRLEDALTNLLRRHEEEIHTGEPISGEEWEIASYALPSGLKNPLKLS